MVVNKIKIDSVKAAVDYFEETLAAHPERNMMAAITSVIAGKRRNYPVIYLNHLVSPDDFFEPVDEMALPEVASDKSPEMGLAREIIGLLEPLKMLNPVTRSLGLGLGPGTLVACFGIPLNPDAVNCPSFTKTIEQVLSEPPPDPAQGAGLMSDMHKRIDLIKEHIPPTIKLSLPDMQGPFNIAHAVVGVEALVAPYLEPEKFHKLMSRITDLWIGARKALINWIGKERLYPECRFPMICECSVNLISPEMYKEFILAYDRRILDAFGPVHIHPCSGPHVFHVTLANLQNVFYTEAGFIAKTAAGSISVDEALKAIGSREIILSIGQELPEGEKYEFIKKDLDLYEKNPRLIFGYTGMHWRKKDRPHIRDIHKRLDEYWAEKYS